MQHTAYCSSSPEWMLIALYSVCVVGAWPFSLKLASKEQENVVPITLKSVNLFCKGCRPGGEGADEGDISP